MEYLTVEDLQEVLHLTARAAMAFMRSPSVPSVKIGGKWLIDADRLKEYLGNNKTTKLGCQ